MTPRHAHDLNPLIDKLASRSPLGDAEIEALRTLPYRLAVNERGSYLVREGDKPGTVPWCWMASSIAAS